MTPDQADLVENPFASGEEKLEPLVPVATLQIYQAVEKMLARQESTHVDRASSANMCVRRRWYQRKGTPGTPLTPRKILNFAAGDIGEHVVKYFIKIGCVGPGKLYSEVDFGEEIGSFDVQKKQIPIYAQADLTATIGGIEVTAHADGWGKRNIDGQWELIEVKTAASYGFDKFVDEGPGDYIKQAHALMMTTLAEARAVKAVRFFYLKKDTGHIWDRLHLWDDAVAADVASGFMKAAGEKIPERPHAPIAETYYKKPTGRSVLPWQCGYCSFTATCWPGVKKEFKSGKPVFVVDDQGKATNEGESA